MKTFEQIRKELETERTANLSPVAIMKMSMVDFYNTIVVDAQTIYREQLVTGEDTTNG